MKVTGFTFIRNAVKLDYPVVEAIQSILPLCSDFVVAVGNSEDGTLELIKSIDEQKIRVIETVWDDSMREGGKVLALETDKAYAAISEDADWCFYIQGDEVVHEKYHPTILAAMQQWKDDKSIDGLLFKYLHFYGSYDHVGVSPNWYKHEIRIIRKNNRIYSYRDAQGFRKGENEKLTVAAIDAYIYHYGWVREPKAMQRKQESFSKLWHDDQWMETKFTKGEQFDYERHVGALRHFEETHPAVMKERIKRKNWIFDTDITFDRLTTKQKLKNFIENRIGFNLSYKNYLLKK